MSFVADINGILRESLSINGNAGSAIDTNFGTISTFLTTFAASLAGYLPLSGGTMSGDINLDGHAITNAGTIATNYLTTTSGGSVTLNGAPINLDVDSSIQADGSGAVTHTSTSDTFTGNLTGSGNSYLQKTFLGTPSGDTGSILQVFGAADVSGTLANSGGSGVIWDLNGGTLSLDPSSSIQSDGLGDTTLTAASLTIAANLTVTGEGSFSDGTQGLIIGAYTGGFGYGAIYPFGVTPGAYNYLFASNGSNTVINTSSQLSLDILGIPKVFLASSGNVGIGTTSPAYSLDVLGAVNVFNGAITQGASNYPDGWFISDPINQITKIGDYNISQNGTLIVVDDNAETVSVDAGHGFLVSKIMLFDIFLKNPSNGTEDWSIFADSSDILSLAPVSGGVVGITVAAFSQSGNVGIGITSPSYPLEVVGDGGLLTDVIYGVGTFEQDHTTRRGLGFGYDPSTQTGAIVASSSGAASNIAFHTYSGSAWGEKMRITGGGNVGIGTTSPAYLLDLLDNSTNAVLLNINGGLSTGYSQLGFTNSASRTFQIGMGNASESSLGVADKFYLYDGFASAVRMTVDTNGNVGIGTTSPLTRLHSISLNSPSSPGDILWSYDAAGEYRNSIANNFNTTAAGCFMTFLVSDGTTTGQNTIMSLQGSGNVGIGTAPNTNLDVRVGTDQHIGFSSDTGVCRISTFDDAVDASVPLIIQSSNLSLTTQGTVVMQITNAGNVVMGVLPTSSAGLASGTLWNNLGILSVA